MHPMFTLQTMVSDAIRFLAKDILFMGFKMDSGFLVNLTQLISKGAKPCDPLICARRTFDFTRKGLNIAREKKI